MNHFPDKVLVVLHLNGSAVAGSSSQNQVTINWTADDFSLEISLTFLPNKEGQLSVWLPVKSDQNKVNADGGRAG